MAPRRRQTRRKVAPGEKLVLRACIACTEAANGVRQPTHGRGKCPFKDGRDEQRKQRLSEYKAVTRAARDKLVANRRTKLDEAANSDPPPSELSELSDLSELSELSELPPSDFPPSDDVSDASTVATRADDWEDGRRAAASGVWLDELVFEEEGAAGTPYGSESGAEYEADGAHADDESGAEYEADGAHADDESGAEYEADGAHADDESGAEYEVHGAHPEDEEDAEYEDDGVYADDYLNEHAEDDNGEVAGEDAAGTNGEVAGEDAAGTVWIYDDEDIEEGALVVEEGGAVADNDAAEEDEDEVDDSLIKPIRSDDPAAVAAMPFHQLSSMLSKVYDSTNVRGRNILGAVQRIRSVRTDNLSKESEPLPNLWKGTRSDVKVLEGMKHASPYCREDRVLNKWLKIASKSTNPKAGKKSKTVKAANDAVTTESNEPEVKKSNKWHDVAPQFASACLKLEGLSDWAPSWAYIALLPKDGSGQMYSWASESVMAEKPELVEVMRRTMFGELRELRKQAFEEWEQERLDLAQQHTNAEARLRCLEAELAEANAKIAEQSEAHKQLLETTQLWKSRCMTERGA